MVMTKHWTVGVVVAVAGGLMTACPAPKHDDDSGGLIEAGSEEGGATEESGSESSDGALEGDGSSTGVSFILKPDSGIGFDCDVFAQDCAEGEKCMPYANDGGNVWNATVCRDVADSPAEVGDACVVEGSGTSGYDDCAVGAMCWDVDAETGMGTCAAMCEGSQSSPLCGDPDTACTIANDGALALCLSTCDPLLQDCEAGQACYPVGGEFACAPDASGQTGLLGETCAAVNACDPGLMCAVAAAVSGCTGEACCTELCAIDDPQADAECGAAATGHSCEAFYDEGQAPPGYETVGVCIVPQ